MVSCIACEVVHLEQMCYIKGFLWILSFSIYSICWGESK